MQLRKFKIPAAETSSQSVHFLNVYYRQERSLLPYVCLSLLAVVVFQSGLFFYKNLFCQERKDKLSQLIDIEFLSQADFKDTKNLLPASVPKPSLAKRTSPVHQSKGELYTDPVFVVRAGGGQSNQREEVLENEQEKSEKHEKQEKQEEQEEQIDKVQPLPDKNDLASRYLPMNVPISRNFRPSSVKSIRAKNTGKTDLAVDMEEVKPPEMVEVTENDGDNSYNHWQDGGRSNNGAGLSSSLAEYLKNLHRKLKHAWTPPSDTVHHIKVIFRLDANGNLVSAKLIQSGGNKDADDSALAAIKKAAPFGPLPNDYPHQFLDLAYTFNYTTDELSEINRQRED